MRATDVLRYYESIGVISPISRGASSKHRVYDEDDQVNEAYERVLASDVRYRFVIDTSTLG